MLAIGRHYHTSHRPSRGLHDGLSHVVAELVDATAANTIVQSIRRRIVALICRCEGGGHMRAARILFVIVLVIASSIALRAQSQQPGIERTDLQRHDLSLAGREVVQVRVDFAPGAAFPEHIHPGEEIAYVIEGSLEYRVEGRPPLTLEAGEVLFIPAGAIHAAKNGGEANAAELATYIVEKGKPLVVPVR
jgi:quercetin dioxygenase-like cupin family protein